MDHSNDERWIPDFEPDEYDEDLEKYEVDIEIGNRTHQDLQESSSIPEGMTIEQVLELTKNLEDMMKAGEKFHPVPNRRDRRAWKKSGSR